MKKSLICCGILKNELKYVMQEIREKTDFEVDYLDAAARKEVKELATITEDMKALVSSGRCLLATAGKEGRPNIGPKGSVVVLDDSTLAYGELTGKQSYKNVQDNPLVSIAVVDYDKFTGYRFSGTVEIETSGELYELFAARFAEMKLPRPAAAVKVKVEEIHDLSAANPGGKIA
ncbi:MAG: pyridoxamine 5'-phosphate oxidase family protein [Bacillota bacterium]